MAYSPTTWVEGVTTLGPTNLNKIETELARLKTNADLDPAAAIAISKLASYPSDGTKVLKGDGTWGPTYTSYTPTWTSSGVAPAIGNAVVTAYYTQVGKLVHAYGSIVFGGTSTYGTGQYIFALPVAPSASISSPMTIGTAQLTDTSATAKASVNIEFFAASTVWLVYPATWPSGTSTAVAQTAPWTWAAGDTIAWNLIYEAA